MILKLFNLLVKTAVALFTRLFLYLYVSYPLSLREIFARTYRDSI